MDIQSKIHIDVKTFMLPTIKLQTIILKMLVGFGYGIKAERPKSFHVRRNSQLIIYFYWFPVKISRVSKKGH